MTLSLEEALGLAAAAKPQPPPEKPEKTKIPQGAAEFKIIARRWRVFELRCRGYTVPQIYEKLGEEGQICVKNAEYCGCSLSKQTASGHNTILWLGSISEGFRVARVWKNGRVKYPFSFG